MLQRVPAVLATSQIPVVEQIRCAWGTVVVIKTKYAKVPVHRNAVSLKECAVCNSDIQLVNLVVVNMLFLKEVLLIGLEKSILNMN